jgi:hypothetical protein
MPTGATSTVMINMELFVEQLLQTLTMNTALTASMLMVLYVRVKHKLIDFVNFNL